MFEMTIPPFDSEIIEERDEKYHGKYDDGAGGTIAYPMERLRNKLNMVLGVITLLKEPDADIELCVSLAKDIDVNEVIQYVEDVEESISHEETNKNFGEVYKDVRV